MGHQKMERIGVSHTRKRNSFCDLSLRFLSSFKFQVSSFFLLLLAASCSTFGGETNSSPRQTLLVVVGAPGEPDFMTNFLQQATAWQQACDGSDWRRITIGLEPAGGTNDFDRMKAALAAEPKDGPAQLWIILIGHGTFDGKEAKFNLRGPDVSAGELAAWLKPFHRPMAIIDTTSCSAPFLNALSGSNRVVVSATRSGNEQNYTRFGTYLARAIRDPAADLDKDGQVSLLEAFLMASHQTAEFYKAESRLATEHALLDDNGDGLGTPADWFRGVRAIKKAKDQTTVDGLLAAQFCIAPGGAEATLTVQQRAQRDALERAVYLHREKKQTMSEDQYYKELERLLLELAQWYQRNGSS
jgi:hypothetical protein